MKLPAARSEGVPNTAPSGGFRAPIASKLAELRKAIAKIEATPRKGFTPKQRKAVYEAYEGRCAGCDEVLKPGWQVDHIREIADGGKHEPDNWQPLCGQEQNGCHVGKTAAYLTRKAKADRIARRETEGPKPSRLKSKGFSQWRNMKGEIVRKIG